MKTIERVKQAAKKCDRETVTLDATADGVGMSVNQGDVQIRVVPDDYPRGKKTRIRQLAPGSTRGSRHIAEGDVAIFEAKTTRPVKGKHNLPDQLHGPVLVVGDAGCTVTHPEHRHYKLTAGTYRTEYQQDHAMEEVTRVQD